MAEPVTDKPEKPEALHSELAPGFDVAEKFDVNDTYGLSKSRFDELSLLRTLWVFKRSILVSLAVYTGYVCEGFEVSANSGASIQLEGYCHISIERGSHGVARSRRQCYCE